MLFFIYFWSLFTQPLFFELMRKITLIIALFFIAIQGNAQIADGSIAPDFTATDINGNTWTLSEILASGKTVIMDISATWCGPCWNYHNNHTLDDIYQAYGPDASDEVVVLFVEGDPTTGDDDLHGLTGESQGDWVEGSPYPIIDDANIADLYEITYFPTIFRICPNGIVKEIGSVSANSIRTGINSASGCGITLTGVQNNAHAIANENGFCSTSGAAVAKVKNLGENILTSATLNLKEDGNVVATKAFTGTINRFATKTIPFDSFTFNPASTYTFEVVNVNASPLFNSEFNTADLGVSIAPLATTDIVVKVYTDNWPTEISWKIKNSANVVVASGGPYVGNATNGGGADANTTKTHTVTLADNDCYSVQLIDAYGDGWSIGNTPHGFEVFSSEDVSLVNIAGDNIGTGITKAAAMTTTALGVGEVQTNKFGIYPNPTSGIFQISTESAVQVSVVDMLGKTVFKADNITSDSLIDLSGFQKGIYMVKVVGDNATATEKVILK